MYNASFLTRLLLFSSLLLTLSLHFLSCPFLSSLLFYHLLFLHPHPILGYWGLCSVLAEGTQIIGGLRGRRMRKMSFDGVCLLRLLTMLLFRVPYRSLHETEKEWCGSIESAL